MRSLALLLLLALTAAAQPRKAPSFTLPDIKQNFYDLTDYRGKVVVIELMQTSCPHCGAFAKVLEQVKNQYGNRVQVFSIVNPPETLPDIQKYIANQKITFPILYDCGQAALSYVRSGQVSLPRVWLVDGAGMIRRDVSYTDLNKAFFENRGIFSEIDKLLAPPTPANKK